MAEKSDVIDKNFGVVIAFWLPGFLLLWGLTYSFPQVSALIPKPTEGNAPSVGVQIPTKSPGHSEMVSPGIPT